MLQENLQIPAGARVLITTDNWFYAPDGRCYRAVTGKLVAILTDEVLGIHTNRNSTNWYVQVGNMMIAGCQIHYAMRLTEPMNTTDHVVDFREIDGVIKTFTRPSYIYDAGELTS
jgi:hypothetical protein